ARPARFGSRDRIHNLTRCSICFALLGMVAQTNRPARREGCDTCCSGFCRMDLVRGICDFSQSSIYGWLDASSDNRSRVPLARRTLLESPRMTELPLLGIVLGSRLMSSRPKTPRLDAKRFPLPFGPPIAPGEGLRSSSCWTRLNPEALLSFE